MRVLRVFSAASSCFFQRLPHGFTKCLHRWGDCMYNRGTCYCVVAWFVFMIFVTVSYNEAMKILKRMKEQTGAQNYGDFTVLVIDDRLHSGDVQLNVERMRCYAERHGYNFRAVGPEDPLLQPEGGPCEGVAYPTFCAVGLLLNRTAWTLVVPGNVSPLNTTKRLEDFADSRFDVILQQDFNKFDISPDVFLVRQSSWTAKFFRRLAQGLYQSAVRPSGGLPVTPREAIMRSILKVLWASGCRTRLLVDQPAECDTNAQLGCDYLVERLATCADYISDMDSPGQEKTAVDEETVRVNHLGCVIETLWTLSNMDAQGIFHWHRLKILRRAQGIAKPLTLRRRGVAGEPTVEITGKNDFLYYDAQEVLVADSPPKKCSARPGRTWQPVYQQGVTKKPISRYDIQGIERDNLASFLERYPDAEYAPNKDVSCCFPTCHAMPCLLTGQPETRHKWSGDRNKHVLDRIRHPELDGRPLVNTLPPHDEDAGRTGAGDRPGTAGKTGSVAQIGRKIADSGMNVDKESVDLDLQHKTDKVNTDAAGQKNAELNTAGDVVETDKEKTDPGQIDRSQDVRIAKEKNLI